MSSIRKEPSLINKQGIIRPQRRCPGDEQSRAATPHSSQKWSLRCDKSLATQFITRSTATSRNIKWPCWLLCLPSPMGNVVGPDESRSLRRLLCVWGTWDPGLSTFGRKQQTSQSPAAPEEQAVTTPCSPGPVLSVWTATELPGIRDGCGLTSALLGKTCRGSWGPGWTVPSPRRQSLWGSHYSNYSNPVYNIYTQPKCKPMPPKGIQVIHSSILLTAPKCHCPSTTE